MQTALGAVQATREQKVDGLASAPTFSANWFAAYTNSHHEKRVALHFAERQIEAFLPLYLPSTMPPGHVPRETTRPPLRSCRRSGRWDAVSGKPVS